MSTPSFFAPVSVIALLLAFFFVSVAILRHLGARRARADKNSADRKPWQIANPYTASPNLTAGPPPATLAPRPAAGDVASDPANPVFRQFGASAPGDARPDSDTPGYDWE